MLNRIIYPEFPGLWMGEALLRIKCPSAEALAQAWLRLGKAWLTGHRQAKSPITFWVVPLQHEHRITRSDPIAGGVQKRAINNLDS